MYKGSFDKRSHPTKVVATTLLEAAGIKPASSSLAAPQSTCKANLKEEVVSQVLVCFSKVSRVSYFRCQDTKNKNNAFPTYAFRKHNENVTQRGTEYTSSTYIILQASSSDKGRLKIFSCVKKLIEQTNGISRRASPDASRAANLLTAIRVSKYNYIYTMLRQIQKAVTNGTRRDA